MPKSLDSKVAPMKDGVLIENERNKILRNEEETNIFIKRHCITMSRFNIENEFESAEVNFKHKVKKGIWKFFTGDCKTWKRRMLSLLPFISIMKKYQRSDLFNDIVAGLTVGVMHIPQGMAYGFLANIDPIYGLYTSFFSVFVYFFFGTSRHISIGVFAVISLMIGNVVDKADCRSYKSTTFQPIITTTFFTTSSNISTKFSTITTDSMTTATSTTESLLEECKVQHVLAVTFLVGLIQLLMGVMKVGFLTTYLSEPLTRAFTTAAAVHVIFSQLKHVFGVNQKKFNGPFKIILLCISLAQEVVNVNIATLITCVFCMALIYILSRWVSPKFKKYLKMPLPSELLVMVIGTLISYYGNVSSPDVFNIKVLGNIPQGIPPPRSPNLRLLPEVALDAVAISIVTFTINISMATMLAVKHSYTLESNQELMAYGLTNMVCSCFNCYVSAASLSRSVVQESTGGKTQIAGIVSSMLLLIVLLFIGPLFYCLPNCILAAVIIVNFKSIFNQFLDLKYLKNISTSDFLTWIVTFLSVVLLDVDLGLLVGLAFSFLTIVIRSQVPKLHVLGNIEGTEIYVNITDYKYVKELDGVKVLSLSSSLFFANVDKFKSTLKKIINNLNGEEVICYVGEHVCEHVGEHVGKHVDKHVREHVGENVGVRGNEQNDDEIFKTRLRMNNENNKIDINVCDSNDNKNNSNSDNNINNNSKNNNNNFNDANSKNGQINDDDINDTSEKENVDDSIVEKLEKKDVTEASSHPLIPITPTSDNTSNNNSSNLQQFYLKPPVTPDTSFSTSEGTSIHHVIVDCRQVVFIDVVGISALDSINKLLSSKGITLSLAACNREVYVMLMKAMEMGKLKKCQVFVTLHDAVVCAIK